MLQGPCSTRDLSAALKKSTQQLLLLLLLVVVISMVARDPVGLHPGSAGPHYGLHPGSAGLQHLEQQLRQHWVNNTVHPSYSLSSGGWVCFDLVCAARNAVLVVSSVCRWLADPLLCKPQPWVFFTSGAVASWSNRLMHKNGVFKYLGALRCAGCLAARQGKARGHIRHAVAACGLRCSDSSKDCVTGIAHR